MDEAIRQTLAPHVAGVDVALRFDLPRTRIPDSRPNRRKSFAPYPAD